jgi:hypothetical protein
MHKSVFVKIVDNETGKIVYRKRIGRINLRKVLNGDLGTHIWGKFLGNLLTYIAKGSTRAINLVDEDGTTRTIRTTIPISGYLCFNINYDASLSSLIKLGTSNTPPARGQFKLQGTVLATLTPNVSYDENTGLLQITASWTPSSNVTVYEIGLFLEMQIDVYSPYKKPFMFDRTVITEGIPVNAGQTLSVGYQLMV